MTRLSELALERFKPKAEFVESGSNRANKIVMDLFKSKNLKNNKSKMSIRINIRAIKKLIFLTLGTKEALN